MPHKLMVVLFEDHVAPRFDQATEVLLVDGGTGDRPADKKVLILPHPSAEQLCQLIITEGVKTVICGGIEEEYYDYLTWKKVDVIDSVIGLGDQALDRFQRQTLRSGDVIKEGFR